MVRQINGIRVHAFRNVLTVLANYCPSDFEMLNKYDGNECDDKCLDCWSYALAVDTDGKDD